MELGEILASGGAVIVVMSLIQVSPIKVNPWSAIAKVLGKIPKAIGRAINGDIIERLDSMQKDIDELKERDCQQDATRDEIQALYARRRIIQFADEIRRKMKHSEEHFDNIFEDVKYYKDHCRDHPDFENNKAVISISIIEVTYRKCVEEDDFL